MACVLVVIMCCISLLGCSSKKGEEGSQPTSKKVDQKNDKGDETTKKAAEEKVTIEWLLYNCYGQPDKEAEIIKTVEEKYGVDFNFWFVDDQRWDEVLGVKLASGDMPDVMRIKNTATVPNLVKQGILGEVTDDMLAKIPTFMDNVKNVDPDNVAFIDCYYEDKLYAIKEPSIGGSYPTVLVWRKDWLKNLGIDSLPRTIDEFEDAIYKFASEDPDNNGQQDTYGLSNTTMNAVFGAYGAIPLKEYRGAGTQNLFYTVVDNKVEFACVQPEMKDALTKLQQWYKDGIIDPEFVTGENKGGYWAVSQDFENNKVGVTGMVLPGHWKPSILEGDKPGVVLESFVGINPDAKFGETVDIGSAIVGPEGRAGTHCWGQFGTSGIGITVQAKENQKKLDTILDILEQNSTDFDFYKLTSWGIEGTHYEIDENNTYTRIDPYNGTAESNQAGLYVFSSGGAHDFVKQTNPVLYDFFDQYMTESYSDILVPQTEAADKYLPDLKTFTLNAYIQIIIGEKPIDYFDEFVTEFNRLGGEQIIKEINSQR